MACRRTKEKIVEINESCILVFFSSSFLVHSYSECLLATLAMSPFLISSVSYWLGDRMKSQCMGSQSNEVISQLLTEHLKEDVDPKANTSPH